MASVRWTVGARQDLRAIAEYIARDSPTYAVATAETIVAAVERLRRHPQIGRMVPEFGEPEIRELIVGNYRVVYYLRGQRAGVLAVVHASRDLLRRIVDED